MKEIILDTSLEYKVDHETRKINYLRNVRKQLCAGWFVYERVVVRVSVVCDCPY